MKHIQTKANTDKLCETMQNQRYLSKRKKQRNLRARFKPFPLLEFSPPLESCSDIYAGPTSCLVVTLLFNVLFLWYFPLFYLPILSIYSRFANIHPVHSNWARSSLSLKDMMRSSSGGAAEFSRLRISSAQNCSKLCFYVFFFNFYLSFYTCNVCNDYVRQENTFGYWTALH